MSNMCSSQVDSLYAVFARYADAGDAFCGLCYTPEEIHTITQTPLQLLDEHLGRKLLWETADHWQSTQVYQHYLPRLLQLIGPPWFVDDLYPAHLFETLLALNFRTWSAEEQSAVIGFLECVAPHLTLQGADDQREWADGIAALKDPQRALPSSSLREQGDA